MVQERLAIANWDVELKLDFVGGHTSKSRHHIWLDGLNKRSDCRGVSSDGSQDYSEVVTPTFQWFGDYQEIGKSQFSRRDPKDPESLGKRLDASLMFER